MSGRDRADLQLILDLIAHIDRRLDGMGVETFSADRDEIDLTAYRLATIGEASHRLSAELKAHHPDIPRRAIYGIRHIIAHDCGAIVPERLWNVTGDDLHALAATCRAELDRTEP